MNVSIVNDIVSVDENGDEITTQVTTEWVVALNDGVFTATNSDGDLEVSQPWKFNPDGSRGDWANLDEAVAWFKEIKDHTGE
jgi:hypothetical protein